MVILAHMMGGLVTARQRLMTRERNEIVYKDPENVKKAVRSSSQKHQSQCTDTDFAFIQDSTPQRSVTVAPAQSDFLAFSWPPLGLIFFFYFY
jgi:hypothetical protein